MKIVYMPQAAADIAEIFDYINERHPQGAMNVKQSIHSSINNLARFPYLGVRTDCPDIRMLVVSRYPYLIFYMVIEATNEIFIVNIRHSSRRR